MNNIPCNAKIFRLSGGFGNQLWSYAACYQYCRDHGEPIILDTSTQEADWFFRNFDIAKYKIRIDYKICYKIGDRKIDHLLFNHVNRRRAIGLLTPTIYENKSVFQPELFEKLPNKCYLIGDWQKLGYIDRYADELRKMYVYDQALSIGAQKWMEEIEHTRECVAIHVRRGDKAAMGGGEQVDYFVRAMEYIKARLGSPTFYVFSDDCEYVKAMFGLYKGMYEIKFVEYESEERALEDFEIMRCCRHFILSNSTYGWWAAYLASEPNQIVVYPDGAGREGEWPQNWKSI